MARYTGPVCRLCRRERMKLFLKGDRCFKEKCAIERRGYPPGQHGQRRGRRQLGYGVLEKQFRNYFKAAERRKGITGENLLALLESRLDNVVYSLGFASSRAQARQFVRHGHILVDGRKTTIPSYEVQVGQSVAIKENSRKNDFIRASVETARGRGIPTWLELESDQFSGKMSSLPKREEIKLPVEEQLIVELYSK